MGGPNWANQPGAWHLSADGCRAPTGRGATFGGAKGDYQISRVPGTYQQLGAWHLPGVALLSAEGKAKGTQPLLLGTKVKADRFPFRGRKSRIFAVYPRSCVSPRILPKLQLPTQTKAVSLGDPTVSLGDPRLEFASCV